MNEKDIWQNNVFSLPIISQLNEQTAQFHNYEQWPDLRDFQLIFKRFNLAITPVAQSKEITCFEEQYEPRVFLKGELQTRTENWHDFFNAMVWLRFPVTKKLLNDLHYASSIKREVGSNRSTLENRITQFDECGAIIVTSDQALLELIHKHRWKELFIENRHKLERNLSCIVFGHAIFEKALKPYIGMTCHCLLINNAELLADIQSGQIDRLDKHIASIWREQLALKPEKLSAFPILGMPGLWQDQDFDFYNNSDYFR